MSPKPNRSVGHRYPLTGRDGMRVPTSDHFREIARVAERARYLDLQRDLKDRRGDEGARSLASLTTVHAQS